MLIQNEIKSRSIELSVLESALDHYPSFRIQIHLVTEEFEGNFDRNIWISEADVESFINGLQKLDESRNGQETLNSMSPGEFHLGFKNIDKLGHLAVVLRIKKESSVDHTYHDDLKIEFEIDPTSLPKIINQLSQLITHKQ
jgi:hypothetical protein